MIYVFRTQPSNSARDLAEALGGRRLRSGPQRRQPLRTDHVVCWGESYQGDALKLNHTPIRNKLEDALKLAEAGIPTVTATRVRPQAQAVVAPVDPAIEQFAGVRALAEDFLAVREFARNAPFNAGLMQFEQSISALRNTLAQPVPQARVIELEEWLGRTRNHVGGRDLLNPVAQPDYWVKKESITREFRVHSFRGASIRAGIKKAVSDQSHQWIRSLDAGWKISYDGVTIRQAHRDLAHKAVQALALDFGAVDIAERADGSLIVLEVNRAPGLDGGTITAYADAVRKWTRGE